MSLDYLNNNVVVIIRSVGERTEKVCHALVCEQVPEENVDVIHERPFGAAVRKTLQIGIERGLRWTFALDADVLLRSNAIRDMLTWAEMRSQDFFFANFTVADKLLGQVKMGGLHIYKTSLIGEALKYADSTIDTYERPESLVRERMSLAGFSTIEVRGLIIGLHAFEQWYRDIYRTAYVHILKHSSDRIVPAISAWKRLASLDSDFRVALAGAEAAIRRGGRAVIDDRLFPSSISDIEELADIEEKPVLEQSAFDGRIVAQQLGEFSPFAENIREIDMSHWDRKIVCIHPTFSEKIRAVLNDIGVFRFLVNAFGAGLIRTGELFKKIAMNNLKNP